MPTPTEIAQWTASIVAVAAVLATVLPPPDFVSSGAYRAFYGVVQKLAFNFGRAANKD